MISLILCPKTLERFFREFPTLNYGQNCKKIKCFLSNISSRSLWRERKNPGLCRLSKQDTVPSRSSKKGGERGERWEKTSAPFFFREANSGTRKKGSPELFFLTTSKLAFFPLGCVLQGCNFFWRGKRYGKGIEAVKVAIKMSGNVRVTFPFRPKKVGNGKSFFPIVGGWFYEICGKGTWGQVSR